jgi:hypothetical protein
MRSEIFGVTISAINETLPTYKFKECFSTGYCFINSFFSIYHSLSFMDFYSTLV